MQGRPGACRFAPKRGRWTNHSALLRKVKRKVCGQELLLVLLCSSHENSGPKILAVKLPRERLRFNLVQKTLHESMLTDGGVPGRWSRARGDSGRVRRLGARGWGDTQAPGDHRVESHQHCRISRELAASAFPTGIASCIRSNLNNLRNCQACSFHHIRRFASGREVYYAFIESCRLRLLEAWPSLPKPGPPPRLPSHTHTLSLFPPPIRRHNLAVP